MRLLAGFFLIASLAATASARDEQRVRGRVVDERGKPVVGARVHVGQYWPGGIDETDAEGRFEVTVAPGMRAPITIFANGFRTKDVEAEPGTEGIRIVLDPGVTIRGRLIVPKGASFPSLLEVVASTRRSRTMKATVAKDGSFRVRGFEPSKDPVRVCMRATGYSVHIADYRVDSERPEIDMDVVRLVKARPLTVTVLDHHAKPLALAEIVVRVKDAPGFTWRASADDTGRAHFPATSNQALEVEGFLPDGRPHWTRWSLERGRDPASLKVRLWPHVLLTGKLEWTGSGAAPWASSKDAVSVLATVYRDGKQVTTWFGRTERDGKPTFVLEKAHPGRFEVQFSVALARWWRSERIAVEVPKKALDAGRHDIGVVRIAPKAPR